MMRVTLGVTGGIAAYKAAEIASRLKKQDIDTRAVLTEHALRFISPATFEGITGNQAYMSLFDFTWEMEHLSLSKNADLLLIAPCTANVIGKLTSGIADDLLTTTAMAMAAPILLAPAMNADMWRSAANQHNVRVLKERGVHFMGPETGRLACGAEDIGRMSPPEDIVAAALKLLYRAEGDLNALNVLVTAGPTREAIDPVRYISNHSSGKMGYAIAEAAYRRGAAVTLITGPVSISAPGGTDVVRVETTAELHAEVTARASGFDVIIQAAAPSDFRPENIAENKIKRTGGALEIKLTPNPDIAAQLGREKKPGQVLVAFAAETENLIENARDKLKRKNADLVVANDVTRSGAGFGSDDNRVALITENAVAELPLMPKREVADAILDAVIAILRDAGKK